LLCLNTLKWLNLTESTTISKLRDSEKEFDFIPVCYYRFCAVLRPKTPDDNREIFAMIQLDFEKAGGLLPAVVQDASSGKVLMLAYMNREAWEATLSTAKATFYSRSRNTLWVKGLTSGHIQLVKEIRIDCDNDAILLKVEQVGGAACHTGHQSCFFRKVKGDEVTVIGEPVFDPKQVYGKG
jgi:phosphoribosyl-AMP cyclohydrolase